MTVTSELSKTTLVGSCGTVGEAGVEVGAWEVWAVATAVEVGAFKVAVVGLSAVDWGICVVAAAFELALVVVVVGVEVAEVRFVPAVFCVAVVLVVVVGWVGWPVLDLGWREEDPKVSLSLSIIPILTVWIERDAERDVEGKGNAWWSLNR